MTIKTDDIKLENLLPVKAISHLLTPVSFLLTIILFLLNVRYVTSQTNDQQGYVVKNWNMQDGLPQSSVNDIHQSKDGYIYLATFGGLVRFDGVSFKTFNRANTKGMRSDRILNIFEGNDGILWLGTEDGLLKFENGECQLFIIEREAQNYSPLQMAVDDFNVMWLSVSGKPYRMLGGKFNEVPVLKEAALIQKAIDDTSGIVLAHNLEILETVGDQIVQIADFSGIASYNFVDIIEYPKKSGTYFIATTGEGILKYKNGNTRFFSVESGLVSRYAKRLYVDHDNTLWAVTYNGLHYWDGDSFKPFDVIESTDEIHFTDIIQDFDNNFWVGTPSKGFYKIRPSFISTISQEQGLMYESMLSLTTLKNGTKLFSTNCGGLYEWDGIKATYSVANYHLINLCNWSVFEDSKGRIWFGSRVLYMTNALDKPGKLFGKDDGFEGIDIFAITEDRFKNIYIGSLNGVYKYDGTSFERFSSSDGLSYNDTRTIFIDPDNDDIWLGTTAGLNRLSNGKITPVSLLPHAIDSINNRPPYVRAIHKDSEGVFWIGTYGNGLFRIKNGNISNITQNHGLFDNIISHLVEDENGYFWMGSNKGVGKVSRTSLNELIDGKIASINSYYYGISDGMISAETNGGFMPNVIQSDDGKLYFPTISGVAVIPTYYSSDELKPPKVRIESLKWGNNESIAQKSLIIDYNSPFLEINYTALSFIEPKSIRFRYRLSGLNEQWYDAGNRRSALFTNIPPGEYIFTVTASTKNGVWNPIGDSITITVIPPFYLTKWFFSICIIFLLLSAIIIYLRQIDKFRQENERQKQLTLKLIERQEIERRRIAAELHDSLGQQILVIKNRAEIAQMDVQNPEETVYQLNEIKKSAINSMQNVRSISHNLRPVHLEKFGLTDSLENLFEEIKATVTSINWDYTIENIDNIIEQSKEINLYRVFQESINNIIKHSQANQASIQVMRDKKNIYTTIKDNGIGMGGEKKQKTGGLGLTGMRERIESINGTLTIESQANSGTTITIIIPI